MKNQANLQANHYPTHHHAGNWINMHYDQVIINVHANIVEIEKEHYLTYDNVIKYFDFYKLLIKREGKKLIANEY